MGEVFGCLAPPRVPRARACMRACVRPPLASLTPVHAAPRLSQRPQRQQQRRPRTAACLRAGRWRTMRRSGLTTGTPAPRRPCGRSLQQTRQQSDPRRALIGLSDPRRAAGRCAGRAQECNCAHSLRLRCRGPCCWSIGRQRTASRRAVSSLWGQCLLVRHSRGPLCLLHGVRAARHACGMISSHL